MPLPALLLRTTAEDEIRTKLLFDCVNPFSHLLFFTLHLGVLIIYMGKWAFSFRQIFTIYSESACLFLFVFWLDIVIEVALPLEYFGALGSKFARNLTNWSFSSGCISIFIVGVRTIRLGAILPKPTKSMTILAIAFLIILAVFFEPAERTLIG